MRQKNNIFFNIFIGLNRYAKNQIQNINEQKSKQKPLKAKYFQLRLNKILILFYSGEQRSNYFRITPKTRLADHVISRHNTNSAMDCALKCQSIAGCISINFKLNSLGQEEQRFTNGMCELNVASITKFPNDGRRAPNFDYLDKITDV